MGTSTAKPTGYISGEDPATLEANRVYQDALARLSQSLDTRKNRFFDPILLAAAQGFGAPTQTGSFGESLGNVAKNVSAAQAEDIKQEQAINEQRVAAAGKGVELQRMRARDADILKFLRGDQPAEPPAKGPLSAAAIAGPDAGAVAGPRAVTLPKVGDKYPYTYGDPIDRKYGESETRTVTQADLDQLQRSPPTGSFISLDKVFEPRLPTVREVPATATGLAAKSGALPDAKNRGDNRGIQISPPIEGSIKTLREYVQLNRNSGKSLFDLQQEWQEIQRKNLEVRDSFVYNKSTGIMDPTKAAFVDVPIFGEGYDGKIFTVSESAALELSLLQRLGDAAGYKIVADKSTGRTFGQPPGSKPVTGGSVTDRALAAKQAEALAAASTAMEIENRQNFATRGKDASEMLATANVMRSLTEDPNFKKMTGILSDDRISSGIALLFRDGIGGKNFSIGIPAIEDIMRNAKLTTEQQATYRTFLMYATQMQLNAERAMKGATTQNERLILGNANISPQDTAEAVRRKADLLTTKGQFDRQAARAFKASKMTAEEFLDSDQYMGMYDKYFADISGIATGLKSYQKPAAAAPAGTPPAGAQPVSDPIKAAREKAARERVREEMNKK